MQVRIVGDYRPAMHGARACDCPVIGANQWLAEQYDSLTANIRAGSCNIDYLRR